MSASILVVEDEAAIRDLLSFTLKQAGFSCHTANDGEAGLEWLVQHPVDLILVDWMMPGIDGIEFLRRLRANEFLAHIPAIMLTARGESDDTVKGLSVGADDYINKPFSPAELIARIRALLRRTQPLDVDRQVLAIEQLTLDTKSHRVAIGEQRVELGPTEFRLLHFLLKNPERAFSRTQLLDNVWGDTVYIEERTIDVHIRRLRRALEPFGHDHLIQTVRGVGYRLSASE